MSERPNLLMICVDDLRPLMGCYGHASMHTPHFDRLADSGVLFERAYCQVPVCGASRCSLLTGVRPTPDRFVDYHASADEDAPGVLTLPQHLKAHGYTLVGNAKVFHHKSDRAEVWDRFLVSQLGGFPGPYYSDEGKAMHENWQADRKPGQKPWVKRGPAYECVDVPDEAHKDGEAAAWAVEQLRSLKDDDAPFCLAYGSINTHLPFKAPKRYWDLYDPRAIDVSHHTTDPNDLPMDPDHAWHELRNYTGMPKAGPVTDEQARTLIHGYMAGVSYLDAQVGKLLDALDAFGLTDNTAVVLWVDHGFNLGEHRLWCKHCLYEPSVHVPLMVRGADGGPLSGDGFRVRDVVENLDIYPTVCELLGLPTPRHVQGCRLAQPKGFALSRYHNGESIRTDRYRYIEYRDDDGEVTHRCLFDWQSDPGEMRNVIDEPSHAKAAAELAGRLREVDLAAGW